jgi:pimeloyl-ACP methyl ester carboxylesterase
MRTTVLAVALLAADLVAPAFSQQQPASWPDPSPHTQRFVSVEKNVRLEVLDWGGTGTPVVLLAGGGNTAHVFDDFAPKLTTDHHVYGITRRGFGASGFSTAENALDRLRDDVLGVIDALKLERPGLVGHSIAGAELSAVATASPNRVSALVYLDAGYPYAFDNGQGPTMNEFQVSGPRFPRPSESDLASFSSLQMWDAEVFGFRKPEAEFRHTWDSDSRGRPRKERDSPGSQAFAVIMANTKKYTAISVPALMIFAIPHTPENWIAKSTDSAIRDAARIYFTTIDAAAERQARQIEAAVPTARVVRLHAAHHVFLSNETDTLREMRAFFAGLK